MNITMPTSNMHVERINYTIQAHPQNVFKALYQYININYAPLYHVSSISECMPLIHYSVCHSSIEMRVIEPNLQAKL